MPTESRRTHRAAAGRVWRGPSGVRRSWRRGARRGTAAPGSAATLRDEPGCPSRPFAVLPFLPSTRLAAVLIVLVQPFHQVIAVAHRRVARRVLRIGAGGHTGDDAVHRHVEE